MNYAYIVCRMCGFRVSTPFVCRCDALPHFIVTCPRCGCRGVYSYENLVEPNEKMCRESCEKSAELSEKLYTYTGLSMLVDAIATVVLNVARMLSGTEEEKENK